MIAWAQNEIDLFGFQGFDEALGGRIVVGISLSRHADPVFNYPAFFAE
jgi:hypothetical protein